MSIVLLLPRTSDCPAVALVSILSIIEQPQSRGCSAALSSPPHIPAHFAPPWSHLALRTSIQTFGSRDPDTLPQLRVRVRGRHKRLLCVRLGFGLGQEIAIAID